MARFIIEGPTKLRGEFTPKGAKNAALKMMAAAILGKTKTTLHNVPDIIDIDEMANVLGSIGIVVSRHDETLTIDPSGIRDDSPDQTAMKKFRGSVVVIGPLLAMFGKLTIPHPGGCVIGARPIDTHLNALKQLGASVREEGELYHLTGEKLVGTTIILEEASVTATEIILMTAVTAKGTTVIRDAAMEPEIVDLGNMLIKMGAKIKGLGTTTIIIDGVSSLKGVEWTVLPDRIEIGTIAIAGALTHGELIINSVIPEHLDLPLLKFRKANVNFNLEPHGKFHRLILGKTTKLLPISIKTQPYPGFPTDLQAPMSVLATQAMGTSTIYETLFESRLNYTKELSRMGAKIHTENNHQAVVHGPTPLRGKRITSLDLRAGATLIIAAMIAEGESEILQAEHIDRGYADIDTRLNTLGAHIERLI